MLLLAIAIAALVCAGGPALLFAINLRDYQVPMAVTDVELQDADGPLSKIAVLIPARNEEAGIAACVRSALASVDCAVEVIVMDDASTDRTAEIVRELAATNDRVQLVSAPGLPPGWNGKQHACWELAHQTSAEILCFVDADVRLMPECVSRMASFMRRTDSALVSGFPRQITGTTLEWLLLPLIHFILLGFLPISRMRASTNPAFAAGCGQFLMVRREAYFASGGHSAIRETMHDGLRLPKALRAAGYQTDLADITPLATCRMYTSAVQVWQGLAKNATEGLAAPNRIVPITVILLLGQIVPYALAAFVTLMLAVAMHFYVVRLNAGFFGFACIVGVSVLAAWWPRVMAVRRFQQKWQTALFHPVGIAVLLVLEWYALLRKLSGGKVSWKSRAYAKG